MEWYHIYHWGSRALAHDLFYVDSIKRSREMQALLMENTHLVKANEMWEKLMAHIQGDKVLAPWSVDSEGFPLFWQKLTPKTAIDMMKTLAQIQRVSLGMPANAPSMSPLLGHQTGQTRGSGQTRENAPSRDSLHHSARPLLGVEAQLNQKGNGNGSASDAVYMTGKANRGDGSGSEQSSKIQQKQAMDDRSRRIATLLDRARARKAG